MFWAGRCSVALLCLAAAASAKLTETRSQTKRLQRALGHDRVVLVLDGVLERLRAGPSPDPVLLINFPDINTQFKIHLLEETNSIKLTLARDDGELDSSLTNKTRPLTGISLRIVCISSERPQDFIC